MRPVGLRFVLRDASFINTVVSEQKAHEIIDWWVKGTLPVVIGDAGNPHGPWAVSTKDIQAMHTFDLAQMQQGQPTSEYKNQSQQIWRGSGL